MPQIVPVDVWSIDLEEGTYSAASGTAYEAESGAVSGSATILSDPSFSGGKAVGYLGNIVATPSASQLTKSCVNQVTEALSLLLFRVQALPNGYRYITPMVILIFLTLPLKLMRCSSLGDSTWRNTTVRQVNLACPDYLATYLDDD